MFANETEMGSNVRAPAIILLSDGNTHLPEWGLGDGAATNARVQQQRQEAHSALKQFIENANTGIPIYTIGFNFDGSLDMDLMRGIAEITSQPLTPRHLACRACVGTGYSQHIKPRANLVPLNKKGENKKCQ